MKISKKELKIGTMIEMEHTNSKSFAKKIAKAIDVALIVRFDTWDDVINSLILGHEDDKNHQCKK